MYGLETFSSKFNIGNGLHNEQRTTDVSEQVFIYRTH